MDIKEKFNEYMKTLAEGESPSRVDFCKSIDCPPGSLKRRHPKFKFSKMTAKYTQSLIHADYDRRRLQLIEATIEVLAESDTGQITLAQVTNKLGVSPNYTYHYFSSFRALLLAAKNH